MYPSSFRGGKWFITGGSARTTIHSSSVPWTSLNSHIKSWSWSSYWYKWSRSYRSCNPATSCSYSISWKPSSFQTYSTSYEWETYTSYAKKNARSHWGWGYGPQGISSSYVQDTGWWTPKNKYNTRLTTFSTYPLTWKYSDKMWDYIHPRPAWKFYRKPMRDINILDLPDGYSGSSRVFVRNWWPTVSEYNVPPDFSSYTFFDLYTFGVMNHKMERRLHNRLATEQGSRSWIPNAPMHFEIEGPYFTKPKYQSLMETDLVFRPATGFYGTESVELSFSNAYYRSWSPYRCKDDPSWWEDPDCADCSTRPYVSHLIGTRKTFLTRDEDWQLASYWKSSSYYYQFLGAGGLVTTWPHIFAPMAGWRQRTAHFNTYWTNDGFMGYQATPEWRFYNSGMFEGVISSEGYYRVMTDGFNFGPPYRYPNVRKPYRRENEHITRLAGEFYDADLGICWQESGIAWFKVHSLSSISSAPWYRSYDAVVSSQSVWGAIRGYGKCVLRDTRGGGYKYGNYHCEHESAWIIASRTVPIRSYSYISGSGGCNCDSSRSTSWSYSAYSSILPSKGPDWSQFINVESSWETRGWYYGWRSLVARRIHREATYYVDCDLTPQQLLDLNNGGTISVGVSGAELHAQTDPDTASVKAMVWLGETSFRVGSVTSVQDETYGIYYVIRAGSRAPIIYWSNFESSSSWTSASESWSYSYEEV